MGTTDEAVRSAFPLRACPGNGFVHLYKLSQGRGAHLAGLGNLHSDIDACCQTKLRMALSPLEAGLSFWHGVVPFGSRSIVFVWRCPLWKPVYRFDSFRVRTMIPPMHHVQCNEGQRRRSAPLAKLRICGPLGVPPMMAVFLIPEALPYRVHVS